MLNENQTGRKIWPKLVEINHALVEVEKNIKNVV